MSKKTDILNYQNQNNDPLNATPHKKISNIPAFTPLIQL